MNIRIAHEAPISIMDKVDGVTDYSYALVHLFEENEKYFDKFVEAKNKGREIILDNSIFELGTAFNGDKYAEWIVKLGPEWYIVPDVLDDAMGTVDSFDSFVSTYTGLPGKAIAVAQGSDYASLVECYEYLANHVCVDKVALSFNHPFYQDFPGETKYHRMMNGRQQTLIRMFNEGVINTEKPHHLLGCGIPREFSLYNELGWRWIDSLDTSNPVVHGLLGIRYNDNGLDNKESVKLFTLIDEDVLDRWNDIIYNIQAFRKLARG